MNSEYSALRAEILKRVELRYQIVNILLVGLGIGATVGDKQKSPTVLLVLPILSFFLFTSFVQNNSSLRRIVEYLRDEVESRSDYLGWEKHVQHLRPFSLLGIISAGGIFLGAEVVSMALAVPSLIDPKNPAGVLGWLLLLFDVVALLGTVRLMVWFDQRLRGSFSR